MKKLLISGLICASFLHCFSLINEIKENNQVLIEENQNYKIKNEELKKDLLNLERQTYNIEQKFKIAAEIYQVDFKIVYAIARLETGNFTSNNFLNNNNPGGIKNIDGNGYQYFDTVFEGIVEMTRMLRVYYFDKGLTTVDAIGKVYCPDSAEEWAEKVKILINE